MKTLRFAGAGCAVVAAAMAATLVSAGAASPQYRAFSARLFPPAVSAAIIPNEASRGNIGSANTVTADPPVPRPNEAPCVVTLFRDLTFADFNIKPFAYAPPRACPGPWAKVVLVANFNVSAGRQFDRTGQITIGNVNVYYGTTPEPSHDLSPHWRVERDLTDESALLAAAQPGEAILGNLVNSTYTGIITGTAYVQFYPAGGAIAAAHVPDVVLPVPNVSGGAQTLSTPTSTLTATYTFPRNVERAYLDVFAQGQSGDEFWYTCVPTDVAQALNGCPGTAFRETEIAIDGVPAGVAPVYPWIFTGGIDPYLWRPIPGVQTLNFKPYRVDLTPFAARLDNGQPHTVSLGVYNAENYFLATSTLLLYLDHDSRQISGALTRDTLTAAPSPVVVEHIKNANGTISDISQRTYGIEGYVVTSHGRITTKLDGSMVFANYQRFVNSSTISVQDIGQETIADVLSRRTEPRGVTLRETYDRYPLLADISLGISPNLYVQKTTIDQRYVAAQLQTGTLPFFGYTDNEVRAKDALKFDGSFNLLGHDDQGSSQRYRTFDSSGYCYEQSIAARNDVLTVVNNGCRSHADATAVLRAMQTRLGSARP